MRRILVNVGLVALLFAIAAVWAPSPAFAQAPYFGFVALQATVLPGTGTLLVTFETERDNAVDYYVVEWATLPDGVYQPFEPNITSQRNANATYLFDTVSPVIPGRNAFLFVRVQAHFLMGDVLASEPVMAVRLVRNRPKPIDW